jgi:Protein of unknown function (DUF2917)
MNNQQQSNSDYVFAQRLSAGTAVTLAAAASARRIRVTDGKLWLTLTGPIPGSDEWLAANDEFDLSAGQTAVIEAWPCARFEMLTPLSAS